MTPEQMARIHAAAFVQGRPWTADEFEDLLRGTGCFAVGDARCFALVRVIAGEAELLTIATDPTHQRQGLAKACMASWIAEACAQGAETAFLEVAADNTAARALYERHGFARAGLRKDYYRRNGAKPVDALLYSRKLT